MTHGFSRKFLQAMHAQDIRLIVHLPWSNLGPSRKWYFLLKPLIPWVFACGPQINNDWNCVEVHDTFTDFCCTSLLSWIWYSRFIHLYLLAHLLSFLWSINPCARVGSERCFWNNFARLVYVLLIVVCMTICEVLEAVPGSCTVVINTVRLLCQ